ncbi:MAG: MATE family efflux transporter [Planctomycetota bacterium]|nr:MATE family efflux transporter [Planctomycetota bacterium]MDG2142000.1 MATE family efflux transporter [Planctomycetota bacterium]
MNAGETESEEPQIKGLLHLAGPLILSFWFRSLFAWVDTAYAATIEGLGDASVAAIGLALPFEFLMIACWVGTSNALTSRLSAAMGAREGAKIEQLLRTTRKMIVLLGAFFLIVSLGVYVFADDIAGDPDVAKQFRSYGTMLLVGSSFVTFWSILPDSIVKAHHDMKTTMWSGIASTVLNLVLNTLFLFVFGWGILGIALATVLGRFGGLAYATMRARALEAERKSRQLDSEPGLFTKPMSALIKLAIPASMAFVFMAFEGFVFNGLLTRQVASADYLAAWSVLDRMGRFLIMPIVATGVAALPLVARLSGARDYARIRAELRHGFGAMLTYVVFFIAPFSILAGPPIGRLLIESENAISIANLGFRWLPVSMLLGTPLFLARPTFEGFQLARPGLVLSAVRTFVLVVPLGLLGFYQSTRLGLEPIEGLFAGTAAGSLVVSLLALWWLRGTLVQRAKAAG